MDEVRHQRHANDNDQSLDPEYSQDTASLSMHTDTLLDRDDNELSGLIAIAGKAAPIPTDPNSLSRRLAVLCDEDFIRKIAEQLESRERPIPRIIGQLELLESIGKGGMGQVFRARHLKLNKFQAVKVLLAHRLDSPEAVLRFDQEIHALGRLDHPNIVAAHDAGTQSGVPYLVMDYVNGKSLHAVVRDLQQANRQLSCSVAAKIIHQAASAMQYAHAQGIIHRDIKPGNLMIDVQGNVRVMDLGLARVATLPDSEVNKQTPELTLDGQIVGTPDFMPPEQLKDSRTVDERADVYALAATFYLLLTGRVPFPTESPDLLTKVTAILNETPSLPSDRRRDLPSEIDRIIVRCLAKKPEDRFASMSELAESLEPFATGDVAAEVWPSRSTDVAAKPKEVATKSKETASSTKRHFTSFFGERPPSRRWFFAASAAAAFILLFGILLQLSLPGGGKLVIRSDDANVRVSAKLVGGDDAKDIELRAGQPTSATLAIGTWEITLDGIHATEYRLSQNRVEVLKGETVAVSVTREPIAIEPTAMDPVVSDPIFNNPIVSSFPNASNPATSPRQELLAVDTTRQVSCGLVPHPAGLKFDWQMQLIRHVGNNAPSSPRQATLDLDPQGKLAAWSSGIDVVVVSTEFNRVQQFISAPAITADPNVSWNSVKFSPNGERLALCSSLGQEIQIRSRDGVLLHRFASPTETEARIEWMRQSTQLLLWSNNSVQIVDFTGQRQYELDLPEGGQVLAVALHPNDGSVLIACDDERLRRWHPSESITDFVSDYKCPSQTNLYLNHLCWSPDGEMFLVVDDYSSSLYRSGGKLLAKIDEPIEFASWAPGGKFLAGGDLKLYRAETLEMIRQLELDEDDPCVHQRWGAPVFIPSWNVPDEITFLSNLRGYGSWMRSLGEIRKFHPAGNALPAPRWPHPLVPASAAFVGNGTVATVYEANALNNLLIVRDETGKQIASRELDRDEPYLSPAAVAWDPESNNVLIRARYKQNHVYDRKGNLIREIPGSMFAVGWSNSGSLLAAVQANENENDCRVIVYDGDTVVYSSPSVADGQSCLVGWSPDGRWLAWRTCEAERSILNVLDLSTKTIAVKMEAAKSAPNRFSFAFSPNSRWLAFEHRPTPSSSVANLLRLDDGHLDTHTTEIPVETDEFRVSWSNDSANALMGDIYEVTKDAKLESIGSLNGIRWRGIARFVTDKNLLLTQLQDNRVSVHSIDGKSQRLFPFCGGLVIGNDQSTIPLNVEGNRVLLRRSDRYLKSDSVGTLDAETANIEWMAIAYENNESLVIGDDGNTIHGPIDIDRYVSHTIHHPGGRIIPLSKREWVQRSQLSDDELAIVWASDVGARLSSKGALLETSAWNMESIPEIESIEAIDCSDLVEISDYDLTYLTRFVGLRSLDLSNCPIVNLPDLSKLKDLEVAKLGGTHTTNLDALENCPNLKSLDLSRTKVTAMVGRPVRQFSLLEILNLDETDIDSFTLLDIAELTNLKTLSLVGVQLTDLDLDYVKRSLPNCSIVTSRP